MKNKITIIEHPSQLNALNAFSIARRRGVGKIQFSDSFQHFEREQLENEINKNYYSCGCDTSARYLIAGLVIGALLVVLDSTLLKDQWISNPVLTILVITIGGAILGKLVGLVKANFKLKRTIHTVQALWRPKTESAIKQQPDCG